jgi:hypothetical protein
MATAIAAYRTGLVIGDLEADLVGGLLDYPELIAEAVAIVSADDLADRRLHPVFHTMVEMHREEKPISSVALAHEMERRGRLEAAGGRVAIAELRDGVATDANVIDNARRVARASVERQLRRLFDQATTDPLDPEVRDQIAAVEARLLEAQQGGIDLSEIGFTGDRLRALEKRPEPTSPLPELLDPEPHLHVIAGRSKSGKTTLALWLARAWCQRIAPWPDAPELPGPRSLVISREQPVSRLYGTLRRLQILAGHRSIDAMIDNIVIVGRDPELRPVDRRLLTLDEDGLSMLRGGLQQAQRDGNPFGLLVLDSLSRLRPPGVEENDNDAMTAWLDRLEEIAVEFGVYILLIHHVGHSTDTSRQEARSAGRGASAIAAVAQATWLLERVPGSPNQRLLKVDGNAILPTEITFEVCGDDAEPGSINYFRPIDPIDAYEIDKLLDPSEEISTSALAWRIEGKKPEKGERPAGWAAQKAAALRYRWERDDLIEVFDGPHNAKMMRRKPEENERA